MPSARPFTVLHYVGYDVDRGGILAVIRALAAEARFECVLGVNPGFKAVRSRDLARMTLPAIAGETIGPATVLRARRVAREVQAWLRGGENRVFHGHSRAGLLVALRLRALGETRVAATVHCLGRQRWFYRRAARRLAGRVFWLSPAMKAHYGLPAGGDDCLPPCLASGEEWTEPKPPRARAGVVFGAVGGLVPVKEWEVVLEALAQVPADVPVRVLHAGAEDGSAESAACAARLRQRASAAGVAGRFEFRGELADLRPFYREIDCLLVAGAREAFSVAALEAAAAGVPTLAADGPGNRYEIETARLGWLFPAGSASALAGRMKEFATRPDARRWTCDDAALRAFSAPVVAARHEAVYRRLTNA